VYTIVQQRRKNNDIFPESRISRMPETGWPSWDTEPPPGGCVVQDRRRHPSGRKIFRPDKNQKRQSAVDKGWQFEGRDFLKMTNAKAQLSNEGIPPVFNQTKNKNR
jgi:hypothetical protein